MFWLVISNNNTWLMEGGLLWTAEQLALNNVHTVQHFNLNQSIEPISVYKYNSEAKQLELVSYLTSPSRGSVEPILNIDRRHVCNSEHIYQSSNHIRASGVASGSTLVPKAVPKATPKAAPRVTPKAAPPAKQNSDSKSDTPIDLEEIERQLIEKKTRQLEIEQKLKEANKELKKKEEIVNKARMNESLARRQREKEAEKLKEQKRVFINNKKLFWHFYNSQKQSDPENVEEVPPMFETIYNIFESMLEENTLNESLEFNEEEFTLYQDAYNYVIAEEKAAREAQFGQNHPSIQYVEDVNKLMGYHTLFTEEPHIKPELTEHLGRPVRHESDSDSDSDDIHTEDNDSDNNSVSSIEY
jgi:hypothetical protein